VNVGDTVKKGQTIIILEAMKMENNINADKDGKITAINVALANPVYVQKSARLFPKKFIKSPILFNNYEVMKMENNINADKDGKITAINVNKGDSVLEGNDLVIIEWLPI